MAKLHAVALPGHAVDALAHALGSSGDGPARLSPKVEAVRRRRAALDASPDVDVSDAPLLRGGTATRIRVQIDASRGIKPGDRRLGRNRRGDLPERVLEALERPEIPVEDPSHGPPRGAGLNLAATAPDKSFSERRPGVGAQGMHCP